MKIINVTKEQCIGCGACVAIDPEHFEFDQEGKSNVITNENIFIDGNEKDSLVNAMESCPTGAISIIDGSAKEDEEKTNNPDCECDNNCHCQNHCDCHNN